MQPNQPVMKFLFTMAAIAIAVSVSAQTNSTYFLSNPCLSPDGQTVVFSFEGDLWEIRYKRRDGGSSDRYGRV